MAAMNADFANPTALKLLTTAERLFAEEGIDAVSIRRISAEAGQRNNSALQYHFDGKDSVLEAILDYRQSPINQRRLELLANLERQGLQGDVRALVETLVLPFVDLLSGPPEASYYVNLVSQLFSQQRADLLFPANRERAQSLHETTELLRAALDIPSPNELDQRLTLLGLTLNHTVAVWAHQRRADPAAWPPARVREQAATLVAFLVGGLQEPRRSADAWLLAASGFENHGDLSAGERR
jgi:AcrR family transcriptional regulator